MPIVILDKHVGEMDEDETQLLVDPEQRIIKQVTVEDAIAADKLFDDLMRKCSNSKKRIY